MTNLIARLARLFGIGTGYESHRDAAFRALIHANIELKRKTNPDAKMPDPEQELVKLTRLARGERLPETRP